MTERWRNPFPHDFFCLPGHLKRIARWWSSEATFEALRIRAGARHACARLRDRNQKLAASMSAYLAQHDRELARARDAGITYEAVREILGRLDNEEISFGKAVELLRTLAVVAAGKEIRDVAATRAIEKWLLECPGTRGVQIVDGRMAAIDWDGDERTVLAGGTTMRDLCAALGIEVECG
jgi:hypothetical protein